MNMRILIAGLVAAVVFPLTQCAAEEPARAEKLSALFDELKANAAKQLAGEGLDAAVEGKVNSLVYDEQSLADLVVVMKKLKSSDPTTIYAARVLLQPLLRAKPEVMLAGVSEIDRIRKKVGKYKNFKQLNEASLKKLQFPEFKPGTSAEQMLRLMNEVQKLRDAKLKADAPVQMHNLELRRILDTQISLALAADDPGEDKKLMSLFSDLDKNFLLDCFAIPDNVMARVKDMKPERAKAFRDQFVKLGDELKAERREYIIPALMSIRSDANSTVTKQVNYPGIKLLTCANEINKILGEPEIKVPTTTDVDQYIAERDKNRGTGK